MPYGYCKNSPPAASGVLSTDVSVVLSFEICGLTDFRTWIVQWRVTAEVLEPQSVREEVGKMAKAIVGLYERE